MFRMGGPPPYLKVGFCGVVVGAITALSDMPGCIKTDLLSHHGLPDVPPCGSSSLVPNKNKERLGLSLNLTQKSERLYISLWASKLIKDSALLTLH